MPGACFAILDLAGRLGKVLVVGVLSAGNHEAVWDGKDVSGRGMPSGSYPARLQAGGKLQPVRMSLIQ